ncbi:MAG: ribosome recycling factor [Candidatus Latescibacterota bacterium]|nr:ribosome recycling factor [Candidatus Latescibacterota bacterium]
MLEEVLAEVKAAMESAIEALRRDLSTIRTGRASTSMVENLRVDYYGNQSPLSQVATLSVPEPRLIVIKPWEANLIPEIENSIRAEKNLGLNPSNDGSIVRVPIPELTEDRRRDITKVAKNRAEDARVAVRHARKDGNDMLQDAQKEGELSEDDSRNGQDRIQKLTDEFAETIDEITKKKEAEIMEV